MYVVGDLKSNLLGLPAIIVLCLITRKDSVQMKTNLGYIDFLKYLVE